MKLSDQQRIAFKEKIENSLNEITLPPFQQASVIKKIFRIIESLPDIPINKFDTKQFFNFKRSAQIYAEQENIGRQDALDALLQKPRVLFQIAGLSKKPKKTKKINHETPELTDKEMADAMIRVEGRTGSLPRKHGHDELPKNGPGWNSIYYMLRQRGLTFGEFYNNYLTETSAATGKTAEQIKQEVLQAAGITPIPKAFVPSDEEIAHAMIRVVGRTGTLPNDGHSELPEGSFGWSFIHTMLKKRGLTSSEFYNNYLTETAAATGKTAEQIKQEVLEKAGISPVSDSTRTKRFLPPNEDIAHAMIRAVGRTGTLPNDGHVELPEGSYGWPYIQDEFKKRGFTPSEFYHNYLIDKSTATGKTITQIKSQIYEEANIVPVHERVQSTLTKPKAPANSTISAKDIFQQAANYALKGIVPSVQDTKHRIAGKTVVELNTAFRQGNIEGWREYTAYMPKKPDNLNAFLEAAGLLERNLAGRLEPANPVKIQDLLRHHDLIHK